MKNNNKLTTKRTNNLHIRISNELKNELEQMANKENISMSNLVILALIEYLENNE